MSISLVLLAHLSGTREVTTGFRFYDLDSLGNLGLRIFFVISGFLITLLLFALAAAVASHHLVERPLLRLRQRLRRA